MRRKWVLFKISFCLFWVLLNIIIRGLFFKITCFISWPTVKLNSIPNITYNLSAELKITDCILCGRPPIGPFVLGIALTTSDGKISFLEI